MSDQINTEFNSLKILHIAFSLGVTLIVIINHFVIKNISFTSIGESVDVTSIVLICLGIGLATTAFVLFNKMIKKTRTKELNIEELRKAYILKWAFLEAGTLISILLFFFMDVHSFVIVTGLSILFLLIISGPKKEYFN